jgi:hypothetical protein
MGQPEADRSADIPDARPRVATPSIAAVACVLGDHLSAGLV